MKYAIIDIGSSIIKYKIYEYKNETIEPIIKNDERVGLISYREDNKLTQEGMDILLSTLESFKEYSSKLGVDCSYYYATASLRNLKNTGEVLKTVQEKLDIDITILTGHQEADYSFNSLNMTDVPDDEGILLDIGGGSSEITLFKDRKVEKQESIPTGVLKIYYKHVSLLYPNKDEQKIIIDDITQKIKDLNIGSYEKKYVYGIGKTFSTIKKLIEHMKIKTDTTNTIDIKLIDILLEKLSYNDKETFTPLLQVDSERIHTILPSLLIVKALALEFNVKKVYVCNVTLQDGIIYKIINK
ncbi:MAG: exopolyphosphatase [Methanosphaera sp.]|nr:exopolyphosphatase [Methanosphaera sp.]